MVPRSPRALRAGCPEGAGAEHCRAPSRTAPRKPGQGHGLTYLHHKYECFEPWDFAAAKLNSPVYQGAKGCGWALAVGCRGWRRCVLRLLGYAARRLHGVSPIPQTGRGGGFV